MTSIVVTLIIDMVPIPSIIQILIILLVLDTFEIRAHYILLLKRFNLRAFWMLLFLFVILIVKDLEIALVVVQLSTRELILGSNHFTIVISYLNILLGAIVHVHHINRLIRKIIAIQ